MRTTIFGVVLAALALSLSTSAQAVPLQLQHQGRLLDGTGAPLDGDNDIVFALYDAPSGGTTLWTETRSVELDNGFFTLALGETTPLESALFAGGGQLWLGITVNDGAELAQRVAVLSVPYAIVAGQAEVASSVAAGGTIDTTSISIGGTEVIGSDGTIDWSHVVNAPSGSDTLSDLDCLSDQIARYDGAEWACADAFDHGHDAGDLVTGFIDVDRLPVGTSDTEVAAGDHTHTGVSGDFAVGGGLSIGNTSNTCDASTAGTIRWTGGIFEGCDGVGWVSLMPAPRGDTAANGAPSCAALKLNYPGLTDGVYWLDVDGKGGEDAFDAYCDMTTDGGGWTLVGTISGGGSDNWNTQFGYWSNDEVLGTTDSPWSDFKSPAWLLLDVSDAEVLYQRRSSGTVQGQAVLSNACLHDKDKFVDLFTGWDLALRCETSDITVLKSSSVNVNYPEGSANGIAGTSTNGWCWNGGDDQSNTFLGHAGWNQSAYTACVDDGHLGYIGVWQTGSSQYQTKDITGTNWLSGRNYAVTDISFFVR